MIRIKTKLTSEQRQFYELHASKVRLADGRTFYYLPYWVEIDDSELSTLYSFDALPEDVRKTIAIMRETK